LNRISDVIGHDLDISVNVYPNPAADFVTVNFGRLEGGRTVKIVSLSGAVVLNKQRNGPEIKDNHDLLDAKNKRNLITILLHLERPLLVVVKR